MEITKDKVTELFCIIDEFYKVFDTENAGKLLLGEDGVKRRRRKASLLTLSFKLCHANTIKV